MNHFTHNLLIKFLALMLFIMVMNSCAKKSTTPATPVSVYDGSISKAIGCVFAPSECAKQQDQNQKKIEEEKAIQKEWEEIDKQLK